MAYDLILHPDCTCDAIQRIAVDVTQGPASVLSLRFTVFGDVSKLRIPTQAASDRTDDLWQHTCLEAFIASPDNAGYLELNFSPSTQWAAYRFTGYRKDMSAAKDIQQSQIDLQCDERLLVMNITLSCVIPSSLRLGLSAVIEESDGHKSYWALAHPPGKPDFHHRDGFIVELA